ncbi:Exostosin-2 [Oopsacas minuta]|uniref:Exostosin-2 n=1 Tax=Oopsacas minuta TaxID=111878 RepID=A0AAV7JEB4_9METZ|nr:Exostosin-2 [Oopsacas minuta]
MKKESTNSLPVSTYGIPILFLLLTISFLWYNYVITTETEYFPTEIMVNPPNMNFKLLQTKSCRFDTCFEINKCEFNQESLIQVYIYPPTDFYYMNNNNNKVYLHFNTSLAYRSLLNSIQQSPFYVSDPSRACIFILAIDTLIDSDNDPIYTSLALKHLPFWNRGINHLIFSFLPSISNSLPSVSTDRAGVASPGLLYHEYRTGFDISIPVYNFPERLATRKSPSLSNRDIYLLIIIPLEFDTSLEYTLQQIKNQDPSRITILDFCQGDDRCVEDENVNYSHILLSSKYCLLLLGYRYSTPDLLDVMMQGCVPVYIHADYMLPFEEVLDWRLIGVPLRPAFVPQILTILKRIGDEEWNQKHRHSLKIWSRYFSSLNRIALTTLMILNERVFPTLATSFEDWNLLETDLRRVNPLLMHPIPVADAGFTVVIFSNNNNNKNSLNSLIRVLNTVPSLNKILIVSNKRGTSPSGNWGVKHVPIELLIPEDHKLTNVFLPLEQIQTECVMSLYDDVTLTPEEIEFGYQAWREFPERIVGYYATIHTLEQVNTTNSEINIISTKAAFYHNHYQKIFTSHVPPAVIEWVDTFHTCEDVAMNLLINSLTNKPPLLLNFNRCQEFRYSYKEDSCLKVFIELFEPLELQSAKFHLEEV